MANCPNADTSLRDGFVPKAICYLHYQLHATWVQGIHSHCSVCVVWNTSDGCLNPCPTEFIFKNIQIYLHCLPFCSAEIMKIVTSPPSGEQTSVYPIQSQYYCCWCPDEAWSRRTSGNGINPDIRNIPVSVPEWSTYRELARKKGRHFSNNIQIYFWEWYIVYSYQVHLSAIIMRSSITIFCIHNCSDGGRM